MKKTYTILLLIIFALQLNAKNLQAYLSYATFHSPTDGSYIETYLSVLGSSVKFIQNTNGKFQATVQITMVFRQNDVLKDFKKTDLLSPEIDDTSKVDFTFMDQQRFPLPDGDYEVEIQILDKNKADAKPYTTTESLSISYPRTKINVSGIEFVESYKAATETKSILTKNGYDIIPFTINYYPKLINKITFYAEVYNTDTILKADEKFLVYYYIEAYETGKTISDYYKFKKESPKNVIVVFNEFDISNLPTGNYNLVIEVKDKDNKSLASNKMFFQRNNPDAQLKLQDLAAVDITNTFVDNITNIDTLKDYIKSTYPISTQIEKTFAENNIKLSDTKTLKQYFLNFWINRNAIDPEKAWKEYLAEVKKVNKSYSTFIKRGYETDRGRVYLQYGAPNNITSVSSDPSAYPYEIWHYYSLANQKDRKFVFYLPDLVTNDYELIHSNANGEYYNPSWQMQLNKRDTPTHDPDKTKGYDYFGGKADDYYNHPH